MSSSHVLGWGRWLWTWLPWCVCWVEEQTEHLTLPILCPWPSRAGRSTLLLSWLSHHHCLLPTCPHIPYQGHGHLPHPQQPSWCAWLGHAEPLCTCAGRLAWPSPVVPAGSLPTGVIFQTNKDGSLPPHVMYKIRQNSSFTEKTNEIRRAYWRPGPNTGGRFYFLYGFVWIQGECQPLAAAAHVPGLWLHCPLSLASPPQT